ncbi:hypothetical protein OCC_05756 [Thermococcus litoralis DSM 5473]|uniref:Uncharacterized protein n=1 Tax=Thermococcus litoralis (strain ATCC 51850 / DSM 5473 / JCM 8560 / NS-C) TaxID=523849 RepID=H3ZMU9_THELN|nr:hypothetical protein [Thermococcus litoralis]EHR78746.1 hypothetical protein OCC_05756 [Thermococcus litoralis DSM 5473]
MPFGVSGWKWKVGRFGYMIESEPNYEEIKAKAKEVLSRVAKGAAWRCRCGSLHIPLIVEGQIIGELWEDVDPKEVEVGAYWFGRWGTKVQLVKDGRVVGFIWLA